jgi:hypothetical protein
MLLLSLLGLSLLATACGGGASPVATTPAPAFLSTPGTSASQGNPYAYQIEISPATGGINLALTAAPPGATLSGNTVTWTPSAAQSRVANQFSLTASNAGGSAAQSWVVTPAGTVTGTFVTTYWTSSGPVQVPFNWTTFVPGLPEALVPQPDGSFQTLNGSGNSDGTFSIPNVPGGYFWLQPGPGTYWTSSSAFDFGIDINGLAPSSGSGATNTSLEVNLSGLDPLQIGDQVTFLWDVSPFFSSILSEGSPSGATTLSSVYAIGSNVDFSQTGTAFLLQYEPEIVGPFGFLKLALQATIANLSMNNGTVNNVTETLAPSPQQSFDLNVNGSAWTALLNNAGPGAVTPLWSGAGLEALPFLGANMLAGSPFDLTVDLLAVLPGVTPVGGQGFVTATPCGGLGSQPMVNTDRDFGLVQYVDPFPSAWPRAFEFCIAASVAIPASAAVPVFSTTIIDSQYTAVPTSQIVPLIGQVQNPTVNGMSSFVPTTVNATGITLSWTAPSGTTPTGYVVVPEVSLAEVSPMGTVPTYLSEGSFYTAKTSVLLPPLQAGKVYLFMITSILDGAANFETHPRRSALPTASVSILSAPITINP